MFSKIVEELEQIQREEDIKILFACESGSRAWGFASPDSDYDVRFVYYHSLDWYLSIDDRRDVIELNLPGDLDVAGWELRKTLRLAKRSNPPLHEWMRSPIMYQKDEALFDEFVTATKSCYSSDRCYLHYFHMAQGNYKEYLQGDEVLTKKYLYVLRPLMACLWIEKWPERPVPMEFDLLRGGVVQEASLMTAIDDLLELKARSSEITSGPRISAISDFIERELARIRNRRFDVAGEPDTSELEGFFQKAIGYRSPVSAR
ncbi:MAG: nucleotidyltransferase domain-containing protein [Armatimonadetes bacterium]|nr:nucleotidyltransferase domain-containing protein [Armatimonadota bacterium]